MTVLQDTLQPKEVTNKKCFNSCFGKFQKIPKSIVLIFVNSSTLHSWGFSRIFRTAVLRNTSGRLLLRLSDETVVMFSCSTVQSPGNQKAVQKNPRKLSDKNLCWCTFLILATKTLDHDRQFPGKFLKYFRTAVSQNSFGPLLLEPFLFHGSSRPKVLEKLL